MLSPPTPGTGSICRTFYRSKRSSGGPWAVYDGGWADGYDEFGWAFSDSGKNNLNERLCNVLFRAELSGENTLHLLSKKYPAVFSESSTRHYRNNSPACLVFTALPRFLRRTHVKKTFTRLFSRLLTTYSWCSSVFRQSRHTFSTNPSGIKAFFKEYLIFSRVIKILFQHKFSQPFGLKLWSSVHNDIFVSKELRLEVTPYCVELLGYFCRLWNMSDVEDRARMLSYFRKYVSTIVELLNRRELAIKDKHSGTKTSADIVFILKFLPKQVWGQIKYRWHFMDLELVKYPSFIDSSSYMNKMCVLMRHTEYYCCQLPGTLKNSVSPIFKLLSFNIKSSKTTADSTRSSRTCSHTAAIDSEEVQYFSVETWVDVLRNTFRAHFTKNSMGNSKSHAFWWNCDNLYANGSVFGQIFQKRT